MASRNSIFMVLIITLFTEVHFLSVAMNLRNLILTVLTQDFLTYQQIYLKLPLMFLVESKLNHVHRQDLIFFVQPKTMSIDPFVFIFVMVVD